MPGPLDKESLHDDVDRLVRARGTITSIVAHILIDLGRIKVVECTYEDCCFEDRGFDPPKKGATSRRQMCVDHIAEDGPDRLVNLQLVHQACNVRKARRFYVDSPQRGDEHWSRRKPHLVKRGKDHYLWREELHAGAS